MDGNKRTLQEIEALPKEEQKALVNKLAARTPAQVEEDKVAITGVPTHSGGIFRIPGR